LEFFKYSFLCFFFHLNGLLFRSFLKFCYLYIFYFRLLKTASSVQQTVGCTPGLVKGEKKVPAASLKKNSNKFHLPRGWSRKRFCVICSPYVIRKRMKNKILNFKILSFLSMIPLAIIKYFSISKTPDRHWNPSSFLFNL